MRREVVACCTLGDEGAELNIFPCHFLGAHVAAEDGLQLVIVRLMTECQNRIDILFALIVLESFYQAVVSHFCGVGDEGDDGVRRVSSDSIEHLRGELFTELLALAVDILVGAA